MNKARLEYLAARIVVERPIAPRLADELITALRDAWAQLEDKDAEIERLRAQLGDWGEELADRDVT